MQISVTVTNQLSLNGNLVGEDLAGVILDDLIVHVESYGNLEDSEYQMGDIIGDSLIMPRGYAVQLKKRLAEEGHTVRWIDRRIWQPGPAYGRDEFHFRPHQPEAVKQILIHQQGAYKAPTGSGKTVTACGVMWKRHPMYSLILVDRVNLVDQWMSRIQEHIGVKRVGQIASGKWNEQRITVATVQTLHRALKDGKLPMSFFKKHSFVWLDEMHHVTAETINELMDLFWARIRGGTSATPDKTGEFELARWVLGEVFYETTHEELRRHGLLVEPSVEVVHTNFNFPYFGDHDADKNGECEKPGCKNDKPKHHHRNNYQTTKKALINDPERNALIIDTIAKYARGEHSLVVTDQTQQIDALLETWMDQYGADPSIPVGVLTGKDSRNHRADIISQFIDAGGVLFSTIAGEALDIAEVSRIHCPFPTGNPRKREQEIGRGTRMLEGKSDVIIFDYADSKVRVFGKQFRKRRWSCYEPLGLKVNINDDGRDEQEPDKRQGLGRHLH